MTVWKLMGHRRGIIVEGMTGKCSKSDRNVSSFESVRDMG